MKKTNLLLVLIAVAVIGLMFVVACPQTDGTTTTTKKTTTTTTVVSTSTTIVDSGLTFTDTELQKGYKLDGNTGITFGIPLTVYNQALSLDPTVKGAKHHGEYWGAWNWNDKRPGVTREGDARLLVKGTNVMAQPKISLSKFISTTEGLIEDCWGDGTKYNWGFMIIGANGDQLPDAQNGGTVANWIAKLSTDTTQWAIKDKDFGGNTDTENAAEDLTAFGATTTMPSISSLTWSIRGNVFGWDETADNRLTHATGTWTRGGVNYTKRMTVVYVSTQLATMFKFAANEWAHQIASINATESDGTLTDALNFGDLTDCKYLVRSADKWKMASAPTKGYAVSVYYKDVAVDQINTSGQVKLIIADGDTAGDLP
jgi:hypothetical protein